MEFLELLPVFEELDDEERQAERDGEQQPSDGRTLRAGLRGPYPQRHRQAAANQHDGIEAAKVNIELFAAARPGCRIPDAIQRVGEDQAAEEHHLGDEEQPHPQRRRLVLLLEVLEMMLEVRMMVSVMLVVRRDRSVRQLSSPAWNRRTPLR